jgi:hypothetical protein
MRAARARLQVDGRPIRPTAGNRQNTKATNVAPQSFISPRNNIAHLHVYKDLAVVAVGATAAIRAFRGLPVSVAPMPDFRPLPKLDS